MKISYKKPLFLALAAIITSTDTGRAATTPATDQQECHKASGVGISLICSGADAVLQAPAQPQLAAPNAAQNQPVSETCDNGVVSFRCVTLPRNVDTI